MIGRLRGIILQKQPPQLLLDVNGVGYEIYAPMTTFYQLPALQESVELLTHLVVREDAHQLYGFLLAHERELFRALIKISGIGPKVALSILSGIAADEFVRSIQENNADRLTAIPGVGKKTAERLVIELRSALSQWQTDLSISGGLEETSDHRQEAMSALTALGYKPAEAKRAVSNIYKSNYTSEELIRLALQQMVK